MFRSFCALPVALMSLGGVMAAALAGGSAMLLSGVEEVRAAPQANVAVHRTKGDRLLVPKGAACSGLGWPNYEESCQFDMRRPADEIRTIRIIALR